MSSLSAQTEKGNILNTSKPSIQYNIESSFQSKDLPNLNWILEEGKEDLKIDDIIQGDFKDANLIQLGKNPYFKIKAHTSYWCNLRFSSAVDLDSMALVMELNGNGWPWEFTFKNVEAHIFNKGNKVRTGLSGTAIPYSERDFSQKLEPSLVWLDLEEKDSLDIWLKLVMAEAIDSEIKLNLSDHRIIKQARPADFNFSTHYMLNGAGIALLLIAFALFIWFRDPIYLWFTIFQFFLFLHNIGLVFNNEAYMILCKSNPRILVIGSTIMSSCMFLSLFQFGRIYIGTKIKFPKVHTILTLLLTFLIILTFVGILFRIVPSHLGDIWFSIRHIPMGLTFMGLFFSLLYLLFTKDKLARVFSFGILFFITLTLARLIIINTLDNPGESHIDLFNHLFTIITTTIILSYRFALITQEKEKANREKLKSDLEKLKQIQLTEQKTKEAERLEELERIKSNFFSNITHEFRTPLTLIIEPLRQVIDEPKKPWFNKAKLAKKNSEKLLQLINQLLDISKLESDQMQLELKRGNILEVIQPMMDSFALLAKEKEINFLFNHNPSIRTFDFDTNKIEKIISNLVSNAIKFTEKNGTINIQIKEIELDEKPYFIFKIKDTGLGITEKEQVHIFDKFYQVDGSNTRKHQGTGIGLSLTKELVELMDGRITLQSEKGKGSTFEIGIPMHFDMKNDIEIHREISSLEVVQKENKTTHSEIDLEENNIALVVEDNDELREFIVSSISGNYQVIEASNGREGLEKTIEFIPNIIISDVTMPEMNGFELCEKIKTNEKTAHIPVILLTAKTAMDSRIQGLEFGADAYMNKPFNTKELLIRMKNLIEVRVLLQQKFSQEIEENTKGNQLSDPIISTFDKQFLERVHDFINDKIEVEEELNVENIAKEMAMSRTQLFRKLKALLNQSPSEFLRNIRLKTAKQLLIEKKGNISEIAYQVGFSSPKYFSTKFKEKYGVSPGEI